MQQITAIYRFFILHFQRILFVFSLSALTIYFSVMAFKSDGVLEWGDGIVHYNIARYAPQKPALFLDHWGKPIFTLLSSPFAQMGFPGMIIFNVILLGITSILLFLWAEKRNNLFAWTIPLLLCSSVVYFDMVNAGMTEILFSTILTATVYLFLQEKYILGAVIFSFALFSRPEGNIIMPVFILFLLWKRQWKALPFLGVGFLLYSIIGYFHYHEFWWFFSQNPYSPVSFYGHGDLLHFVLHAHTIWGIPLLIFSVAAILFLAITPLTKKRGEYVNYIFIVLIPALLVLAVHSYIWWKGLHGSAGLVRVMATVMPLYTILALLVLENIQALGRKFLPERYFAVIFLTASLFLAYWTYADNRGFNYLPLKKSDVQILIANAAKWYNSQDKTEDKIIYYDNYFAFEAGINPFDLDKVFPWYFLNSTKPEPGTWMVWDAKFAAIEGQFPKEKLLADSGLRIVKIFTAEKPIFVNANEPYEIIIARVK